MFLIFNFFVFGCVVAVFISCRSSSAVDVLLRPHPVSVPHAESRNGPDDVLVSYLIFNFFFKGFFIFCFFFKKKRNFKRNFFFFWCVINFPPVQSGTNTLWRASSHIHYGLVSLIAPRKMNKFLFFFFFFKL